MAGEDGTRFAIVLMLVDAMTEAEAVDGVVGVGIQPEWMQPSQELVDCEAGKQRIQLDDGGAVLLNSPNVAVVELDTVGGGISSVEAGRANLVHGVYTTAEKARPARLEVMDSAAHLVNAAVTIGLEFDTEIEIRDEVESGQLVQKVATVDGVHAAEDDVATGNGADGGGIEQVARMGVDDGAKAHGPNRASSDIDFQAALPGVVHRGVQDAVEVLFLDAVGVDENKLADAIARELLDQRAASAGTADNGDAEAAEAFVRAGTKGLSHATRELGNAGRVRGGWPER